MHPPSIQDPDLKQDALAEAIEREMYSLQAGVRNLVARSGLTTSAAEIDLLAQDTFPEVVLKVIAHRHEYDGRRPFRPWFMKFVVNHLRNLRRSRSHRGAVMTPVAETRSVRAALSASGSEIENASEAEMFDLLARGCGPEPPGDAGWNMLLSLVAEADREILTLRFRDQLDHAGIAQKLQITPGGARTRLCRSLERLRQAYVESERFARGEA
jgi:DNA-directed RNA polymerase specialized sigma24 family protein